MKDQGQPKGEQRAWQVFATLVESNLQGGDTILAAAPRLEFSTNWLKGVAKRHGNPICTHPTTLECQLVGAWREAATKAGVLGKSGLGRGGKA